MNQFWNCHDALQWKQALRRYWDYVKPDRLQIEKEFDSLDICTIEQMNELEWYEFLRDKYFFWKYTAPNRYATTTKALNQYVDNYTIHSLFNVKQKLFSFNTDDIKTGLKLTSQIGGLGIAGASGLLSVLFPGKFGTVDQFVVKSLREVHSLASREDLLNMNALNLTVSDGIMLINIMREKAAENNQLFKTTFWSPRKIDMILWSYGR